MANWKQELRGQLDEASPSSSPRIIRKKTKKTINATSSQKASNQYVLPTFLLICILAIAMVSSYNFRNRGYIFAANPNTATHTQAELDYRQDAARHQEYLMDQQKSEWQAERRYFEDQAEQVMRDTWNRSATNRDRLTLLGILYNNNVAAARKGTTEYLPINSDWTIDRYPSHIRLNPEDKAQISKYIKRTQAIQK